MKTVGYISLFIASGMFLGCGKDQQPGDDNKGKERQTVEITVDEITSSEISGGISVSCKFSLAVSDDAGQYAYVVLDDADAAAPDADSILVGEVSDYVGAGTFFHNDGDGPVQHSFASSMESGEDFHDYIIYAAAITPSGLTSEVVSLMVSADEIPMPVPDFEVLRGGYNVNYVSDGDGQAIESQNPGESFVMGLVPYEGVRETGDEDAELWVLNGCWFNIAETLGMNAGSAVNPFLLGVLDRKNYTITFDRMIEPSSIVSDRTKWRVYRDSPYETAISVDSGDLYILRGGGNNGTVPIAITLDKDGKPLTLSACAFAHYDSDRKFIAYYDRMGGDAQLVPIQ